MKKNTEPTFEEAYQRLETIVQELDEGNLNLDELMARFEEGMRLSQRCLGCLAEVEKKVEMLVADENGNPARAPFEQTDESS